MSLSFLHPHSDVEKTELICEGMVRSIIIRSLGLFLLSRTWIGQDCGDGSVFAFMST
jgi:hypothetical protein